MSKQRVIDETQILQMHEGNAQALLNLWNDGLIDLDTGMERHGRIESALETLCNILDRSIRARNQQLDTDHDPRTERYPYEH